MVTGDSQSSDNRLEISCEACGATVMVESHMRTAQCPYCASPSVIERTPTANRPDPVFIVGFVVNQSRATQIVQQWIRSRNIFARSDFKQAAPELTRGVYLPAYLYGAVARTNYSAEIGENYTETETYTTTDSKGNTVTRTRTVTKTEWRSLRGNHACYILDVIVTASKGVSNDELEAIEPYNLRDLQRYSPPLISGWLAEDPSRAKDACRRLAHDESVKKVGAMLRDFMPGDSYTDLRYNTRLTDELTDLVLLPIWSFAVQYDEKKPPVRIRVNGQTGRVCGRVPISVIKVTAAVMLAVTAVAGVVAWFAFQH